MTHATDTADQRLAVIGMAGRFPGAPSVDALWRNLLGGVESVTFFEPDELAAAGVSLAQAQAPDYVPARAILADVDLFDAAFFGYSPRDAEIIDPQQRLFLECCWEAVEQAGYDTTRYDGQVGVYGGASMSGYLVNLVTNEWVTRTVGAYRIQLANDKDHLTMRVAHRLDLRGPAITVQTACSTSLVAVHVAAQALLANECDMALAGGATVTVPQVSGYRYEPDGIMSPDGHCRAFDAAAAGTVAGSGVGVVLLKRLADAVADGDTVHAVILGSAVNNDGSAKAGYTTPSAAGQADVIAEALAVADIDPATVSYVEAHGTGTSLGDPIEVAALARAYRGPAAGGPRAIGSVKTNIGHLDAAAGITGLIKAVLAVRYGVLPPTLHFREGNQNARLTEAGFRVITSATRWTDGRRRAGVSSFGMGGTNAHVVIEEPPPVPPTALRPGCPRLLTLSAATETALDAMSANLAGYLRDQSVDLGDATYTLQVGRRVLRHRRAVVCQDVDDAIIALTGGTAARPSVHAEAGAAPLVSFMFSGQGAQRAGMAEHLYRTEPTIRETVDECSRIASPLLGVDLRDALFPVEPTEQPHGLDLIDTALTQPALFTVEYALARLWMEWGVRPDSMIGHSVGEYVAACLADVLGPEDALALLVTRGRLLAALPTGAMLSVPLAEEELLGLTGPELGLAAVNGPALGVLSGTERAIAACEARLAARQVPTRRLRTSHAFHSPMVEPALADFHAAVGGVRLRPPTRRFVSGVTGHWITDAEATSPDYWTRHLRSTVRFGAGLRTLLSNGQALLLEVGPGQSLTMLAHQHGTDARPTVVASLPAASMQGIRGVQLTSALGRVWESGVRIDWDAYHRGHRHRRIPLPTYPFERRRHWIDAGGGAPIMASAASRSVGAEPAGPETPTDPTGDEQDGLVEIITGIWSEMLGVDHIKPWDSYLELGGHSLLAVQITTRLRDEFDVRLSIERFFELGTVAGLAAEVEALLVAKLSGLTDHEVERLAQS